MRVLVIEDDHRIATSIKKGLEQDSFAVDLAFDGEAGFDLAAGEEYDVIVLDLMLPKMDGIQVCRMLREEEKIHTPILMLTARGELENKINGFKVGADDYLAKPFAFSELLARIRALSRRPKHRLSRILKHNDLELDTDNYQVTRGGKEIMLSKKEFALLEHLLRYQGKTVSKDQLITHVWSYEADILPNTVEVFIGYLRKKLEKPFPRLPKLIQTVRGFGYRIK